MWWTVFQYVMLAISLYASYVNRPKVEELKPENLSELDFPTAELGKSVPVLFGTKLIKSPNVVWYGDLYTRKIMT